MTLETKFKKDLIKDLELLFPGCIILKNDPTIFQGIPDLTIIYKNNYAMLECKKSKKANKQPNQKFYIDFIKKWGCYANFVYPENKEEVLNDLKQAFRSRR